MAIDIRRMLLQPAQAQTQGGIAPALFAVSASER
jgi:hypothetical protein